MIATTYLPPRRPFLPFTDVYRLLNNNIPTYILGDFNARHTHFGNKEKNTVGKSIVNIINQGKMFHLGPFFPTFIRGNSATNPDKIFSNKHHYLNYIIEPGNITSSDHIPIIFRLSTKPFIIDTPPIYKTNKANWDKFKEIIDERITPINLNGNDLSEVENENTKWFKTITYAMDMAIPKTNYKINMFIS